jgi:hypothetical protein
MAHLMPKMAIRWTFSEQVGNHGVLATGIVHGKDNQFRLWNFYGVDSLNTLYLDGRLKARLSKDFASTIEGQTYHVAPVGAFKDYLSQMGLNARYALYGIKGTLTHQPSGISVALALNHFTGDRNTVTAYGNWGGYPEFVSMPYMYAENKGSSAIAGSYLSRVSLLFDLGVHGLTGHSLLLGQANINIDEKILANSDIKVTTLLYRGQLTPELSARVAIDARQSRNSRYDNEFVTLALRYDF